jgi:methylase of polypeptide subunit release factors
MKLMNVEPQKWMDPDDPLSTTLDSGITLLYPKHLEGGCFWLKDEFVKVINLLNRHPYNNCFEWCSGLGGIGFEILGKGLCEHITFSDYYYVAIDNCLYNATRNNITSQVTGYVSPTISDIPNCKQWDLVIGTPPHCFDGDEYINYLNNTNKDLQGSLTASNWARLTIDDGMEIHKEFFQNIRERLTDNADVLILGSSKQDMIIKLALGGNLKFIDVHPIERYGVIYHFKPI